MTRSETIKRKLRVEGIPQWRLAEAVNISENTLHRQLRSEITEDRFNELSSAINELMKGGRK